MPPKRPSELSGIFLFPVGLVLVDVKRGCLGWPQGRWAGWMGGRHTSCAIAVAVRCSLAPGVDDVGIKVLGVAARQRPCTAWSSMHSDAICCL